MIMKWLVVKKKTLTKKIQKKQEKQLQLLGIISTQKDTDTDIDILQFEEKYILSEYNKLAKLIIKHKHISKKYARKETNKLIKQTMYTYNLNTKMASVLKAIELFEN